MVVAKRRPPTDLDDVLLAFMLSCPVPNMDQVADWQARYPQYADDILETAASTAELILSGVDQDKLPNEPGDEALAASLVEQESLLRRHLRQDESLETMIERSGSSFAELEARMGFEGEFLEAATDGELALPVPAAIVEAFGAAVGRPADAVLAAFAMSARSSSVVHMSATSAKPPRQTTYAELIASTDMPDERKAFWLGDE